MNGNSTLNITTNIPCNYYELRVGTGSLNVKNVESTRVFHGMRKARNLRNKETIVL